MSSSVLIDYNWPMATQLAPPIRMIQSNRPAARCMQHSHATDKNCFRNTNKTHQADQTPSSSRWHQLRHMMQSIVSCHHHSVLQNPIKHRPILLLHHDFWLEALDVQHRYGFHLRAFYSIWKQEKKYMNQSFFYWLDHGDGQMIEVPECNRLALTSTRVQYCTEQQRKTYLISIQSNTTLVYQTTNTLVHTDQGKKWIFVLDRSKQLYIGCKQKGCFHHSSFLSGAPVLAAGKIWVHHGIIVAIEPHSGHYKPTLNHLLTLCQVLTQYGLDLTRISFIKPKKWKDEWPFLVSNESTVQEMQDNIPSDSDYS